MHLEMPGGEAMRTWFAKPETQKDGNGAGWLTAEKVLAAVAGEAARMASLDKKYVAQNDRYAFVEEGLSGKLSADGKTYTGPAPTQKQKQMGELVVGHVDCTTAPFLWNYADRFTLFDNFFDTVIGPLINEAALQMVKERVKDAVAKGARVLAGGEAVGPCVQATLITDVPESSEFAKHETFGPVLAVEVVDSAEEGVARANATSYGLSAAILTADTDRGFALAQPLVVFPGVEQQMQPRDHLVERRQLAGRTGFAARAGRAASGNRHHPAHCALFLYELPVVTIVLLHMEAAEATRPRFSWALWNWRVS